eukprot:jgi/Botrbrau1/5183/Bobra.0172s0053.1
MGCCFSSKQQIADDTEEKPTEKNSAQILADSTHFSLEEIYALQSLFKQLSNTIVQDNHIHRDELKLALFRTRKDSLFVNRVFDQFDAAANDVISFSEFAMGVSVFHPSAPLPEKADFAFDLYDLGKTGSIEKSELKTLLKDIFKDNPACTLTDEDLDVVVEASFKEADQSGDGLISRQEFHNLVLAYPGIIDWMTLPILRELTTKYPSFLVTEAEER